MVKYKTEVSLDFRLPAKRSEMDLFSLFEIEILTAPGDTKLLMSMKRRCLSYEIK